MPSPPPSPLARAWAWAVRHPVLVLALVVAVQVLPTLGSRDYWAFDEVRHADALREVLDGGHWFSLHLNGHPYPDKPPVYFWLVAGIARLIGTDGPPAFFLASGLGGFLFLLATWALARTTLARHRPGLALLAPLLVTATPLYQLLLRTTRMDLLFGALIVFSEVLLGLGLARRRAWRPVVGGFALAGLATLVKGPVGLAFPLGTVVLYVLWQGRARRLLAGDVLTGLAAALALIAAWAVGLGLTEGWPYLDSLVRGQVIGRMLAAHKHSQPFWFFLAALPVAWIPWSALVIAPGRDLFRLAGWRDRWRRAWAARREDRTGRAWLGWAFLAGLLLLSLATSKLFIYLMPLLGPLAVLSAASLVRLDGRAAARTFLLMGLGTILVGLALPVLAARVPWPQVHVRGAWPVGALLVLTGLLVLLWRHRPLGRPLGLLLAGFTVANLLAGLWVAPSFDPVMSPRAQAEVIARYADRGYAPLVFKVYPGTYTYYAGRNLPETRDPAILRDHLQTHERVLVATARKYWERHAAMLEGLEIVHEQRIEGRPFVVAVRGAAARPGSGEEAR
ncbi:MAG: ArnT family glycosyltransferase [Planctomycetota bacterium]